jgi:hypothetical protein
LVKLLQQKLSKVVKAKRVVKVERVVKAKRVVKVVNLGALNVFVVDEEDLLFRLQM